MPTNNLEKSSLASQYAELQKDIEDLEWYLREFSSFLPIAVCTVNPLDIIIDINNSFEELTGYQSVEAVGEHLELIFATKAPIEKIKKEILQKPNIQARELILLTKQGKEIPVVLSVSQRKDSANVFTGYFVGITDVTALKNLQKDLERQVEQRTVELQTRVDELERFHELAVGRELKMVELKQKIKELEAKLANNDLAINPKKISAI